VISWKLRMRNNALLRSKLNDVVVDGFRCSRADVLVICCADASRTNELPIVDKICRASERAFTLRRRAKMDE